MLSQYSNMIYAFKGLIYSITDKSYLSTFWYPFLGSTILLTCRIYLLANIGELVHSQWNTAFT